MPTAISNLDPQTLFKETPSVEATINYLDKSVTKPYNYVNPLDAPEGVPKSNYLSDSRTIQITDLKTTSNQERLEAGLTTNGAGFQFVEGFGNDSTSKDWEKEEWKDENWIKEIYYKDIDELLKKELGVTSTFIFDHTVRKREIQPDSESESESKSKSESELESDTKDQGIKKEEASNKRAPVAVAHCDQSKWAGLNRVGKHLGKEIQEKVKSGELKAQIVNVWRGLKEVEDWPLAVADSRTVGVGNELEWRVSEHRYSDWTGETLAIHASPSHRWYYHSNLPTSRALLLKCYDSENETRTPHTAFQDPTSRENAPPRQSIEVRVLTITENN